MGTVYRKTATKSLPAGAKIIVRKGQRLAEWLDAKQKRRTAPVTVGKAGTDRIVITARTYTAKYRDGSPTFAAKPWKAGWCNAPPKAWPPEPAIPICKRFGGSATGVSKRAGWPSTRW